MTAALGLRIPAVLDAKAAATTRPLRRPGLEAILGLQAATAAVVPAPLAFFILNRLARDRLC